MHSNFTSLETVHCKTVYIIITKFLGVLVPAAASAASQEAEEELEAITIEVSDTYLFLIHQLLNYPFKHVIYLFTRPREYSPCPVQDKETFTAAASDPQPADLLTC